MFGYETKKALRQQIADLKAENKRLKIERYEEALHWLTQPGNYRRFKEYAPDVEERLMRYMMTKQVEVGKALVRHD